MPAKVSRPLWKLLLATSEGSETAVFNCDECFLILEYLAELNLSAQINKNDLHKLVDQHLAGCPTCLEYYLERIRHMERKIS